MAKMRLLLISTTQDSPAREDRFLRLQQSVAYALEHAPEVLVSLICVAQNRARSEDNGLNINATAHPRLKVQVITTSNKVSLSHARNLALSAIGNSLSVFDVIAFPDDDCAYKWNTISSVVSAFEAKFRIVVLRHGDGTEREAATSDKDCTQTSLPKALKKVSSNVMFIGREHVQGVWFDKELGLGTKGQSAEDLDYFIRAWLQGRPKIAFSSASVIHPRKAGRQERYYKGNVLIYKKYVGAVPALWWSLARQFFVGLALVTLNRLKLSSFLGAWLKLHRRSNND
jgi:hypothetical protein